LQYCKVCHGVSAQGFRGYYPIPRLAGQQPTYLENQLQAFIEHRRTNNVMFNVAHSLSPSMVTALAANFNALNPPPLGGAPRQLVATGGRIFQDGLPDQDIAACAACHGPDAAGAGLIPRLAGQLDSYVIDKLANWGKERGQNPKIPDTSAIMSPVALSQGGGKRRPMGAWRERCRRRKRKLHFFLHGESKLFQSADISRNRFDLRLVEAVRPPR
jgi:cytochrome c553